MDHPATGSSLAGRENGTAVSGDVSPQGMQRAAERDRFSEGGDPADLSEEDDITALLGPGAISKFDIPIVFNDAVQYNIRWFQEEKRKVFSNWLRRSRRYVPMIRSVLKEHGLPEDLVYLAMIESGFNPKAYSHAKASGPWQFIYATGERYGLKVDFWVDERRDPEKSTVAAARYLKDLFNQFGCWYLAAAGYNAGEKRIERAIERHNTWDVWELLKYNTLPKETREYIPRLIAAAIIAKDPERFGFDQIVYDQPVRHQETRVPGGVPLTAVAEAAGTDVAQVRALNPEILRGVTPPTVREYTIKLPAPLGEAFQRRLAALSGERKISGVVTHKAKKGETLARIMKRYGVSNAEICLVNDCGEDFKVVRGVTLNVPRFTGQKSVVARNADPTVQKNPRGGSAGGTTAVRAVREAGTGVSAAGVLPVDTGKAGDSLEGVPRRVPEYHIVKKGENIPSIARKYGMEASAIRTANNLRGNSVNPNTKLRLASYSQKADRGAKRIHVVRKGETLSGIAEKYGTTVGALRASNKLKSDSVMAGMKLRIAAGGSGQGS